VDAAERYADDRRVTTLTDVGVDEPPDIGEGLAHQLSWRAYNALDDDLWDDWKWPGWVRMMSKLAADPIPRRDETAALKLHVALVRDIFGNPFRPVTLDPRWLTSTVTALARGIYDDRAFHRLPILADALQDAGCDHADILTHCRSDGPHVRGCWVVDLLFGKD
jgi:hypothetical protein